jgi:hypothetical protein
LSRWRHLPIFAVVEDQFYDVHKRLDAQLTRTAEIQQQLEGQRKEIAELRRTVNLAHRLLKELIAKIPRADADPPAR